MRGAVKVLVVVLVAMLSVQSVYGWDAKGHTAIGHIADRNLTPKARKMVSHYLGHSLAYYASWMDQVRYVDAYHHTARWHSVGVKEGKLMPSDLTGSKAFYGTPLQNDDYGIIRLEQIVEQNCAIRTNQITGDVARNKACGDYADALMTSQSDDADHADSGNGQHQLVAHVHRVTDENDDGVYQSEDVYYVRSAQLFHLLS